jgi:hypothetical protein
MDRLETSAVADLLHHITRTAGPSGPLVGLDRAVRAARALAIRARKGKVEGLDCMAPSPATVEAALRGAARPKVAPTAHYPTWTVETDPLEGGPWSIRRDGQMVDTVAAHYAVDEVLAVAEQHARCALAWVLDPTLAGFRSVTAAEVEALPPGRVDADADPEVLSDADTIRQAAVGAWVVHPDIDCGTRRIMHVARGRVAIRVFCTPDGALRLATRQVCPGDVENSTLVSQVLVWLSAEEAL